MEVAVKRDVELVRSILLAVEEADPWTVTERSFPDYEPIVVAQHVALLKEAGYLEGGIAEDSSRGVAVEANVQRLTWEGHEFLDAVRSDTVWEKTKSKIADTVGSVSLEIVKAVAVSVATTAIGGL
jgi:hypothetical protein